MLIHASTDMDISITRSTFRKFSMRDTVLETGEAMPHAGMLNGKGFVLDCSDYRLCFCYTIISLITERDMLAECSG